jgi:UTP:GlnB (protein PII) uridylyltransferase
MQRYYRTVMDISLLNEMLLQLFREATLSPAPAAPTVLELIPLERGLIALKATCTVATELTSIDGWS